MNIGYFYFLSDDYFIDFPDPFIMENKEMVDGELHDRPCFYAFKDSSTNIYWMIPFTSKTDKFKYEYEKKIKKYGKCDTITFGEILGHEKAFLIQNMCPIIEKYIKNQYIDSTDNIPVKLNGVFEKELIQKAKRVLRLTRQGTKLVFPDILKIESQLLKL